MNMHLTHRGNNVFVILSLQLFALIRDLLTEKFQLIHKVCLFKFCFHCVETLFYCFSFQFDGFKGSVFSFILGLSRDGST